MLASWFFTTFPDYLMIQRQKVTSASMKTENIMVIYYFGSSGQHVIILAEDTRYYREINIFQGFLSFLRVS